MPFQDPVTVLVKEYLPEAWPAAENELRVGLPPPTPPSIPRRSCLGALTAHALAR